MQAKPAKLFSMIGLLQQGRLFKFYRFLAILLTISLLCPLLALADRQPPFALPKPSELQKLQSGVIRTSKGDIYVELYPKEAPWHVANFKYLADKKFYENSKFHIHEPGYIIQGGKPTSNGGRGPGYSIPPEFNYRKHTFGVLGMARAADAINPGRNSHGSQFHLLLTEAKRMDGSFTIFGQVRGGVDVLKKLRKGDTIRSITVYVRE
jgi:cyclophilin family peptidyl-prolyl cis-trans isomerase